MLDLTKAIEEASTENQPVDIVILDRDGEAYSGPNGEETVFCVVGEYSDRVRAAEQANTARLLKDGSENLSPEQLLEGRLRRVAAAVTGWRNVFASGEELPCTPANVKRVFEAMPWVHKRIETAMANRTRFFKKPSLA